MATVSASTKSANSKNDGARKQRPAWTKKGFPLTVAVFEFPNANGDGPPTFSVKLTRSFRRDEDSAWENSEFLGANDLSRGAKLLEAANAFVQARLEGDYQSRKTEKEEGEANF